ncbi:hypothetical protein [Flavobacterium sp. XS2P14]|uniref:hypothetical protein n=1 Tax=Flavobacterium sp. XS2P14 TaxID=3401735 RepID=UPI003AAD6BE2
MDEGGLGVRRGRWRSWQVFRNNLKSLIMKIFNETVIQLNKEITLNFLNIENYSDEFLQLIENEIGFIRNGDLSDEDINDVKRRIKIWIDRKDKNKDDRAKNGFIAEFICHIYLRYTKFQQYSLFKNLEERGPKKGFDGLYLLNDEMWLVESKSTTVLKNTHKSEINKAFTDIKIKLESSEEDLDINDPWENAKHHILIAKPDKTLIEKVKILSTDFINNRKHKIKEYNIVPCSTIYLRDEFKEIDVEELKNKFEKLIHTNEAKKLNVICVNKKSKDDFIKYINNK